jgi:hypothetical protein
MPATSSQKVYIANFGHENYLWKDCLADSTIATFQDEDLQPFWLAGDRAGYIAHCLAHKKSSTGKSLTTPFAGRWFNLRIEFSETAGDVWLHHAEDKLWWTISEPEAMVTTLEPGGPGVPAGSQVYVLRKKARRWSSKSKKGTVLHWNGLHPKARDFLFIQGTFSTLSEENAEYALALIEGDDLRPWHARPDWRASEESARRSAVTMLDAWKVSAVNLANIARATVAGANGQQVLRTVKNKEIRFGRPGEFEAYINALIEKQNGRCALTGLEMQQFDKSSDEQLLCSLDRIDSDGHYEPGNLQIVCRFVNKWKSDAKDDEFRRLIALVRSNGDPG